MGLIRLLILLSLTSSAFGSIGSVTEYRGSAVFERDMESLDINIDSKVNMDDEVRTGKGVVGITFEDNTQVRINEHSELIIDDFVYDPSDSSGSLGLLVTMGTVKYASGNIAHNNPDTVDIKTPSATIAVRGTAFTMTVNEIGDSLIILLPNADGTVGEIAVMTDVGQVILNKAFQLTSVYSKDETPSKPITIEITEELIDNWMLIAPPKKVEEELLVSQKDALDQDFLKFDELDWSDLDVDELEFNELNIDELNIDLLNNMLSDPLESGQDGRVSGFNSNTGVYTFAGSTTTRIVRISGNATVDIQFRVDSGVAAVIEHSDETVKIDTIDSGSQNKIKVTQK